MPRQPRQLQVGSVYHIVNRGVEKREIFVKSQDYSRFILGLEVFNSETPADIWQLLGTQGGTDLPKRLEDWRRQRQEPIVEVLAFVLMPNHYHLLLKEITQGGIITYMRKMGGYSVYFNRQYDRVGPLFQGRYKAVEVASEEQLLNVFAYIHTNPIELIEPQWKEFVVSSAEDAIAFLNNYRWSSYMDYIGKGNTSYVTTPKFFWDLLGGSKNCQRQVEDWIKFKAENTKLGAEIIE